MLALPQNIKDDKTNKVVLSETMSLSYIDYNVSQNDFVLYSDKSNLFYGSGELRISIDKLSTVDSASVSIIGPGGKDLFHGTVNRGKTNVVKFALKKGQYKVYVKSLNPYSGVIVRVELLGKV